MIWMNHTWPQKIRIFVLVGLAAVGQAGVSAVAQASGTWSTTGSLNTPRTAHTAVLLQNGNVLVVGGEDTTGHFLSSSELYDPSTGKWTMSGSTATVRVDHTATLLPNGDVLVAGGYLGLNSKFQATYTATAELYNPSTGQWTPTGSMTTARAFAGATLLDTGEVLVAGGSNSDGSAGRSAELYDPSTGTWTATGSMNNAHAAPLTLLQSGQALMADNSGSSYATGELYDPSTGQWTVTTKMYYSHTGLSTALLTSGNVLVYGNKFACYAAESYNPLTNIWARTNGQCSTSVSFGPIALLSTGKVLLAGGSIVYSGHSSATANCSLYDPSTNTWTATGKLKQAAGHTLTVLLNGEALAVGGSDGELYTP